MLARMLVVLISVAVFTGCSSKNLSKREPFAAYVGHSVTLNRSVALLKEGRGAWAPVHLPRLRSSPYVMLELQPSDRTYRHVGPSDTNLIVLPSGYTVTIATVRDEIVFIDPHYITVYGSVTLPGTDESVRFAYAWGDGLRLFPAPWEPESVPDLRYPVGRLSDFLFDHELRGVSETDVPRWGRKIDQN